MSDYEFKEHDFEHPSILFVLEALGGLPEEGKHCALLVANTLKEAAKDYFAFRNEPWKRAYQKR